MQVDRRPIPFMYLNREYFEDLRHYMPREDLITMVREACNTSWSIETEGLWTHVIPSGSHGPAAGWKIHLSGNQSTICELLRRALTLLIPTRTRFKFCSDLYCARLTTHKLWPRVQVGKIITIYPCDAQAFIDLLEPLHTLTEGLEGPYIWTDRPFRNSKVVFYRWGAHAPTSFIDAHGYRTLYFDSPDGARHKDDRPPYFTLPTWVNDPVCQTQPDVPMLKGPLNGRYRIKGAIKYSAFGGLYDAVDDRDQSPVIIREARPNLYAATSADNPIKLLAKQARILQSLGSTGIAPRFVDFFDLAGHSFLVEEKLDAETLWGYGMSLIFLKCVTAQDYWNKLYALIEKLIRGLTAMHQCGIIMRDFTRTNVLVTFMTEAVKFIDYEFSYELKGTDAPAFYWTTGYASPEQIRKECPTVEQDYYSLGALILDSITFTAPGLELNKEGILRGFARTVRDLHLPSELYDVVEGFLHPEPSRRLTPNAALETLRPVHQSAEKVSLFPPLDGPLPSYGQPKPDLVRELEKTVIGIKHFLMNTCSLDREDRLWPASFQIFTTNAVSFEYGAAGTAAFLQHKAGALPEGVAEWILARTTAEKCPAGLFNGISGVAALFLKLGRTEDAVRLLAMCADIPTIRDLPGLYEGLAGLGVAYLQFWAMLGGNDYLDKALEIAEFLQSCAQRRSFGACWVSENGWIPIGLGFGAAGVGAFFTYLAAATGRSEYITIAEDALEFEMAQAVRMRHCLAFFPRVDAPVSAPKSPHVRYGTAGIGMAALRLYLVNQKDRTLEKALLCARSCMTRYTNKLWQDYGLAGMGELLLDAYCVTERGEFREAAFHLAEGLLAHRLFRAEGIAFAGGELQRICCDYGEGSAGIGFFLTRLMNPQLGHPLLPDRILEKACVHN